MTKLNVDYQLRESKYILNSKLDDCSGKSYNIYAFCRILLWFLKYIADILWSMALLCQYVGACDVSKVYTTLSRSC